MAEAKEDEYAQYLERFEAAVGDIKTGQYGRYKGRLVRKLDADQFASKLAEYTDLGERFIAIINAGDTIDDALAVDLRSTEVELLFEKSRYLPFGR